MTSQILTAIRCQEEKISFKNAPLVTMQRPRLWPGPEGAKTEVRAAWNLKGLHLGYKVFGPFAEAKDNPTDKSTINNDDRMETFILPPNSETYYGFEANRALRFLDYKARFVRQFDFSWKGHATATLAVREELPFLTISVPWSDLGIEGTPPTTGIRIGLYRAENYLTPAGTPDIIWTNWVDPGVKKVNFHCPETFGELHLVEKI